MAEVWVAIVSAVVGGAVGYSVHLLQSRVPTKDNQDTIKHEARQEALEQFRWAAELAVSTDEDKRALGAGQLHQLVSDPALTTTDLRRVRAAIKSALAPRLAPWDTEAVVETEEGDQP